MQQNTLNGETLMPVIKLESTEDLRHWEAWDVLVNSGNLDEEFKLIFHWYVDGQISREYMASRLATGGGHRSPCSHDEDHDLHDSRPTCGHCNIGGFRG